MKADAASAARFFKSPDTARAAVLLYGPDAMRVALKRQALIATLLGPNAESEMRLTRMPAAELRSDAAQLGDALRAQGFFPGQRAVLLEDATDSSAMAIMQALQDWAVGDAMLVITAGNLGTGAKGLRKLIEGHARALSIGIYADAPKPAAIDALLSEAGLPDIAPDARRDLHSLGAALDPGDFAQTLEKLWLYSRDAAGPINSDDVAAVAPTSTESALDAAIDLLAAGETSRIAPRMKLLMAQGATPVTLILSAARHFRLMHSAASAQGGPEAVLARAWPPLLGDRRGRFLQNLRGWSVARLETALLHITDTDLALRSAGAPPAQALVERAFIRISMMRKS